MNVNLDTLDDKLFWSWLAGFSDGEACFALRFSGGASKSYQPDFILGLRADDWRLLEAIRDRTGLGYLRSVNKGEGKNPQVTWRVGSIEQSKQLANGFRSGSGLFSKKARDFALWAEATELIGAYGGGLHSPIGAKLAEIKQQLHDVKLYHEDFAAGWEGRKGRSDGPRQMRDRGFYNARASKRFWGSELGPPEKLARQRRYSRLTQEQVDEIITRALAGERRKDLADEFGVSRQLIGNFLRGERPRRDGTLAPLEPHPGPKASSPDFWKSEAGQRAHRNQAILRGKLSQQQIDELVERWKAGGVTQNALAAEYGVSRPLISKFIKGNYIRRD